MKNLRNDGLRSLVLLGQNGVHQRPSNRAQRAEACVGRQQSIEVAFDDFGLTPEATVYTILGLSLYFQIY